MGDTWRPLRRMSLRIKTDFGVRDGRPGSQLVPEFLPCNLRKPIAGYASRKPLSLRVALTQVNRVKVVLVVQTSLDKLLHAKQRARVQAVKLA